MQTKKHYADVYESGSMKKFWNQCLRKNPTFDLASAMATARYLLNADIDISMTKSGKTIKTVTLLQK